MPDDWPDSGRSPRAAGQGPTGGGDGLDVQILDPGALLRVQQAQWLAGRAAAAAAELGLTGEVRVRIVTDAEMAAAHERFSGIAGTTDVLTFDLRSESAAAREPRCMDVDLYACIDEARRQAAARNHPVEQELLLYIVHGILHCLGHDDHGDEGYQRMHAEEDRILRAIGVGATFDARTVHGEGVA